MTLDWKSSAKFENGHSSSEFENRHHRSNVTPLMVVAAPPHTPPPPQMENSDTSDFHEI